MHLFLHLGKGGRGLHIQKTVFPGAEEHIREQPDKHVPMRVPVKQGQMIVGKAQKAWRNVVKTAVDLGIPVPSMGSSR